MKYPTNAGGNTAPAGCDGNLAAMKFPSLRISRLVLILPLLFGLAGQAGAIGLGEFQMRSALGEQLQASIPLTGIDPAAPATRPGANCFSVSATGSDGVRLDIRLRVREARGHASLEISSRQPVNEPVLTLLVSIGCDTGLQREYTVLPDFPVDRSSQSPITAAASGEPVIERTSQPAAPTPAPRRKPRPAPVANGDRLVLSSAPLDLPNAANGATDPLPAMAERMLRMETELRHLGNSLSALDEAIRLGEQKAAVRNELKIAESLQSATLAAPATAPTETARKDSLAPWLQMTGSVLLGGLLSVGLLQLADRRRRATPRRA